MRGLKDCWCDPYSKRLSGLICAGQERATNPECGEVASNRSFREAQTKEQSESQAGPIEFTPTVKGQRKSHIKWKGISTPV